jgi:spermidine/putrescine-binding protein
LPASNDPGNLHSVGNMWGTTGIAYEARKVAALAPDAPTDSWRLVFDPKVAQRLASCGIAFIDAPNPVEAHAFIDFMLRPDVAAKNATSVRYATFNRAALPLLDPSLSADTATYPMAEARATARDATAHARTDPRREPDLDAVSDWSVTLVRAAGHPQGNHRRDRRRA